MPANEVLQIAGDVMQARIAQENGNLTETVSYFEKAVELEDRLAYMDGAGLLEFPGMVISLGEVLLQQRDVDSMEQAFRASLVRVPNIGWALYGLAKVYKRRGDTCRAAATEKLLVA